MTENMFQEGLYQVYLKDPPTQPPHQVELDTVRIHRWFGSVVNTRLLLSGVSQILGAVACILTTVTHACVSYSCSVSMTTPVWSSLCFVAAGCLAIDVQRRAVKSKIVALMAANILGLLLGSTALLLLVGVKSSRFTALPTRQQRVGSYVARGGSLAFTGHGLLLSAYVLFLAWRGLRRYGPPHPPHPHSYRRIGQDPDDTRQEQPLLGQAEFL